MPIALPVLIGIIAFVAGIACGAGGLALALGAIRFRLNV